MKKFKSYREQSKINWGLELPEGEQIPTDKIQLGAILRIADATEAMAANHLKLQQDYDYMKRDRDRYKKLCQDQKNSLAGYKGQITRLKNLNNKK